MELTSEDLDVERDPRKARDSGGRMEFEDITIEKAIALLIAAATAIFVGLELISSSGAF